VVKTLIEYERRVSEAGALARSLGESLAEAERRRLRAEHQRDELVARCDRLRADHERAQNGSRQAEKLAADRDDDLRRHRLALHKAVAEISTLRSQVSDLSKAVDQTKQSARVGQILAGIGAVTGVITVASFLGGGADDDDWDSDDE
jgi:chromosome segregation ATPase